ncbi:hypothetical protein Bbelb_098710 [Branchiostoma belcheri]|nr:hypothetical protein Bbelb_098710 [Branchiostoma belcheri]
MYRKYLQNCPGTPDTAVNTCTGDSYLAALSVTATDTRVRNSDVRKRPTQFPEGNIEGRVRSRPPDRKGRTERDLAGGACHSSAMGRVRSPTLGALCSCVQKIEEPHLEFSLGWPWYGKPDYEGWSPW